MAPLPLVLALLLAAPLGASQAADPPFSFSASGPETRDKLEKYRTSIVIMGYRFDEPNDRILSAKNRGPATRAEIDQLLAEFDAYYRRGALERLQLMLARSQGDELNPEARRILESERGVLPPAVLQALEGGRIRSGAGAAVEQAWIESERFFDGQSGLRERLRGALPVRADGPRETAPYFDDAEAALGARLAERMETRLARSAVGRRMLEELKGRDGKVRMPRFIVAKLDPRYGAGYGLGVIAINRTYVDRFTGGALDDAALDRFLAATEYTFVHELQHFVQDRRMRLGAEMDRGNVPATIPVENELECFLKAALHFHETLAVPHPERAIAHADFHDYYQMLTDLDRWQDSIRRNYMEGFPEASADAPTTRRLLDQRGGLFARWMREAGPDWRALLRLGLARAGLAQGRQALREYESHHERHMREFRQDQYHRVRFEGGMALSSAFLKRSPFDALVSAGIAGAGISAKPSAFSAAEADAFNQRYRSALAGALDALRAGRLKRDHALYVLEAAFTWLPERRQELEELKRRVESGTMRPVNP